MNEPKESPTMPAAPLDRTIADSNTGETLTFLETAAESSADRVVMRLALAPGTVVRPHAHPTEEAFECQEGTVDFQLDGHPIELRPGSTVTVPHTVSTASTTRPTSQRCWASLRPRVPKRSMACG